MSDLFPTISRFRRPSETLPLWLSTPWWPADPLHSKQQGLLRVLETGFDERLELAPLVRSTADEHRGRYRRRLKRLAKRLQEGTPLPDALEQTPGVLSEDHILAIRLAAQSGTLGETLDYLVNQHSEASQQIGIRLRQMGFYFGMVAFIFVMVLTYFMIKIAPSYQAILQDFYMDVPRALNSLFHIYGTLEQFGVLILLALLLAVWLMRAERSRRFFRRRIASRVLKPVAWLRSANLLDLFAIAQEAGRPLPGVISTLARYLYDNLIRGKLLFVRNEIEQGAQLWDSMVAAQLISPDEARALSAAPQTDTKVWTMRRLARWKRDRVGQRFDTWIDVLQPVLTLLMAGIVLFAAVAALSPLVSLTGGLS